jgi:hypothetical protein
VRNFATTSSQDLLSGALMMLDLSLAAVENRRHPDCMVW